MTEWAMEHPYLTFTLLMFAIFIAGVTLTTWGERRP